MFVGMVLPAAAAPSIPQTSEDRSLTLGSATKTIEVTQKTIAAVPGELEAF